jgi:hypothetical protein
MKRAALGIRMHSGWGVLVAVCGDRGPVEIVDRRRIFVTDPALPGANQPYHHAASLGLPAAEKYLLECAAASGRASLAAVEEVVRDLNKQQFRIVGSAVLKASGRSLPPLAKILAAHPLIHTAEGEFFRDAIRHACESLKIAVTSVSERELEEQARKFENAARQVPLMIANLGSSIGPPWTKDHKTAALAAYIVLAGGSSGTPSTG